MTQEIAPAVSQAAPAPGSGSQAATVGAALRALRLSKGWSLEEVSGRIKFSARQIEALEEERWDALPTGVSLRGLIRNYARLLGADGQAIAGSLDVQAPAPAPAKLSQTRGLRGGDGLPGEEDRSGGSWGWWVVILLLIAAGVGYAFWQGWLPREWLSFQWVSQLTK
ncbi:transcriptional regulator [Bordetella genomosp. 1]|uniref:Transcriptional regulator n=1 Tax=Bordetella genomosp. 1 TaxID=1395607 RepID=A0A261SH10_9BORD|nr:helix-turn-helix domain-containing protein [Bordetella genomosp. 1]MDQ8031102.1 helix-turn-helix domain-containing protein [Bordetella sp.]OZI36445.1 transcriptional regulator [Bordetella genomosp. 1]OZI57902.1 transcriptional regulator [Bordetella genomosp. 1]